jgi:hypothetical protein
VIDTQKLEEVAAQFSPDQDVTAGKWFGKPCLKVGGKVFAALWGGDLALKLTQLPETVPAEEFEADKGVRFKGYKVTIARVIQGELDDEQTHYAQIEEFRTKRLQSPDGDAV